MSMSVNNDVKESNIRFERNSLISNGSAWSVLYGDVVLGDVIQLKAGSACKLEISCSNLKCDYIKILGHLTSEDNSLSTDNFNNVSMALKIKYVDDSGKENRISDIYYPRYDFEDTYKTDYTIFKVPSLAINHIEVIIYNNENVEVSFTDTGLYISRLMDKENVGNIAVESVQQAFNDGRMDLVIPLIYELPDINSVADGAIFRCAWLEGIE